MASGPLATFDAPLCRVGLVSSPYGLVLDSSIDLV